MNARCRYRRNPVSCRPGDSRVTSLEIQRWQWTKHRTVNKRYTNGGARARDGWPWRPRPFRQGQRGGPGNPFAAEVGKHRGRLFRAARAKDVDQALKTIRAVMSEGKDSDRLTAARMMLDRLIGPAVELDIFQRLEALEAAILKEENHGNRR